MILPIKCFLRKMKRERERESFRVNLKILMIDRIDEKRNNKFSI